MHDITITFNPGDVLAYAKHGSTPGRNFLSDNVKGQRLQGGTTLIETEDLLPLLKKGMREGLSIYWRKQP